MEQTVRSSSCACGRVRFEAVGAPILSAICYCTDCQEGGRRIEALPNATPVRDPDGGTPYLTYRDDRFHCVSGAELLTAYQIKDGAPTRRMVASCCNAGMFLKFGSGHWTSAYRARFSGDLPPIEMRNQTKARKSDAPLPNDAPSYAGFPPSLFLRLIRARIGMLIGR
jgi:hypothetical protein